MRDQAAAVLAAMLAGAAQGEPQCEPGPAGALRGEETEAGQADTPEHPDAISAMARAITGETPESLDAMRDGSPEGARVHEALERLRAAGARGTPATRGIALEALMDLGDACAIAIIEERVRAGEIGSEEAMRYYGRGLGRALDRTERQSGA